MRDAPNCQVTLAEAAEILGLSLHQVRRRIRAGELAAARLARPRGYIYLVTLPDHLPPGAQEESRFPVAGQLGFFPAQLRTAQEWVKLLEGSKEATSPVELTRESRRGWRFWRRNRRWSHDH